MKQILGREPAAIVAAIQTVLVMLASFGALKTFGINTQDDVVLVVAVLAALGGAYTAWGTSETMLAAIVELFKATLSLGALWGLHVSLENTALIIAAINAIFAILFLRPQTTPLAQGSFRQAA